MVREYLLFLDKQIDKPLALSTKSKRCGVIRQVLMLALEEVKFWKNTGMPAKLTKKEIELLIELVVKVEAYEQGKGWLFRTKRRTALIMEYT